jgi:hypothetical protein
MVTMCFGQPTLPMNAALPVTPLTMSVTLAWNPMTNPIVSGFHAYWSTNGVQTNKVNAGMNTSITLSNLPATAPEIFEFTATTYSAAGAESAMCAPACLTNYLYTLTNQIFQIWQTTNRLMNVNNPAWPLMFFRMSNGWLTASSHLVPAAWANITRFNFTNASPLEETNILQYQRTP